MVRFFIESKKRRLYAYGVSNEGGNMAENNTSNRGFASMDVVKQRAIASKGGKATGGKNLTPEARSKGGRNSHGGGRRKALIGG